MSRIQPAPPFGALPRPGSFEAIQSPAIVFEIASAGFPGAVHARVDHGQAHERAHRDQKPEARAPKSKQSGEQREA
jgi:hypothetical protein